MVIKILSYYYNIQNLLLSQIQKMTSFYIKINSELKNIWRYAAFYPLIKEENQLTLGEGNTPEIYSGELAAKYGFADLIFKREDCNPNGSHKDRMLAYQISRAKENGEKVLIISSSGNAAVSAAAYCQLAGIKLFVFVSPKTDEDKISRIANFGPSTALRPGATIIISKHALTLSDLAAKKFKIKNLRSGADENSYYGLKSIAFELFEHCRDIDAIFIPTSSAGTLLGISSAYNDLLNLSEARKMPALYAVQTAKVHPIAAYFDKNFIPENETVARGIISKDIGDENLARLIEIIKSSNGGGAVVSNNSIIEARGYLAQYGIITGYESAAAFAGAIKNAEKLKNRRVVVLLTGKTPEMPPECVNRENIFEANDINQVEILFNSKIKYQKSK